MSQIPDLRHQKTINSSFLTDTTHIALTPSLNLLLNIVSLLYVFLRIPHMHYSHVMSGFLAHLPMPGSLRSHRHHKTISQSRKTIYCFTTTKPRQLLSNLQPLNQPSERQEFIPLIAMLSLSQPSSLRKTLLLRPHNPYQLSYHQFLFQHPQHQQQLC